MAAGGNVAKISPHNLNLHAPAPLRDMPLWCVWRFEGGGAKPLKVPYYTTGGRRAGKQGAPEDRAQLTTFAMAKEQAAKRGMDGVGFAPLPGCGIVALDFDNCVTDGKLAPDVLQLVGGTYAEYSPSGRGIRAFFQGDLGNRKASTTASDYGFETFSSSGFVTVTGNMLPHIDLLELEDAVSALPQGVRDLCERRFSAVGPNANPDDFMAGHEPKLNLTMAEMEDLLHQLDPDMPREEWIKVGMALHHETEGDDTGFYLWDEWSGMGGKYPSEAALRAQWDSFERRKGSGHRQVTMASVKRMVKMLDGGLTATEIEDRADAMIAGLPRGTGAATPDGFEGKFPVHSAGEASRAKPPQWLIKGVLPQADLIVLYGAPGAGKSFVALDLAAAVARGAEWRGCRTKRGRVIILAAEGGAGYGTRIKGWCQHHNVDPSTLDVGLVTVPPNLLNEDDITELVAAIKAVGDVVLVIVDTFAQATPGANENASEDMGRAVANCRVMRNATGATVALVHHSGKDASRGARGWSGLRGAVDAEIEVARSEEGPVRMIRITKQKDGRDGDVYAFLLETLAVGVDDDGDAVTTCVTIPTEAPKATDKGERAGVKRRGKIENHVLEIMSTFGVADVISHEQLVRTAMDSLPEPDAGERDTRRQLVARAILSLSREKDGPLKKEGNRIIFYE